jgi:hypothetical protein
MVPSLTGPHTRLGPHLLRIIRGHFSPNTRPWRKFCWRRDAVRRAASRWSLSRERCVEAMRRVGLSKAAAVALVGTWPELTA